MCRRRLDRFLDQRCCVNSTGILTRAEHANTHSGRADGRLNAGQVYVRVTPRVTPREHVKHGLSRPADKKSVSVLRKLLLQQPRRYWAAVDVFQEGYGAWTCLLSCYHDATHAAIIIVTHNLLLHYCVVNDSIQTLLNWHNSNNTPFVIKWFNLFNWVKMTYIFRIWFKTYDKF